MTDQPGDLFPIKHASYATRTAGTTARFFVGLQLDHGSRMIRGALLRALGSGLTSDLDVVGTGSSSDARIELALASMTGQVDLPLNESAQAASLAEAAAEVVHSLTSPLSPEQGVQLAVALEGFGLWQEDPVGGRRFLSRCDTGLLSKMTGLTVIDDFPSRDLAYGGRGGPLEAAGLWMLLGDRGTIPGRRIRALVELGESVRLVLMPPRQADQLPAHLIAHDLAPGQSFRRRITRRLVDKELDDLSGKLAVQGRHRASLLEELQSELRQLDRDWSPGGPSAAGLMKAFQAWNVAESISLHDALCTVIHLSADCLTTHIRSRLPRSQPIGQLILSGADRHNGLLVREIKRRLPEIDLVQIDDWNIPNDNLLAAAVATLALLLVDQIPANSPNLTGTDVPRILGRLTPGSPASWHQVLASIARTLPEKLPLRSAI